MIVDRLPASCPRCRAALYLDRGEMRALLVASAGMDQPLTYEVYLCTNGHSVQVGGPTLVRSVPASEGHRLQCGYRLCRRWFLGRAERVFCSKPCSNREQRLRGQAPKPRRANRPPPRRGPSLSNLTPRLPQLPFASKRGSYRWG